MQNFHQFFLSNIPLIDEEINFYKIVKVIYFIRRSTKQNS